MKKFFITGLVILLPLAVTIAIVIFIVDFLTKPFMGVVVKFLSHTVLKDYDSSYIAAEHIIRYGSQIIILIALFLITLGLGFIARWFFFNSLIRLSDKILHKIPIVNKVYKTSQEIIKTLFITDKNSFKQVVMIPFPDEGNYGLGLVSRNSPKVCTEKLESDLVSVFVPTAPNPTTGFLLMYKKEDLFYLDMKTEEAIKYIVSCGVIIPEEKRQEIIENNIKEKK